MLYDLWRLKTHFKCLLKMVNEIKIKSSIFFTLKLFLKEAFNTPLNTYNILALSKLRLLYPNANFLI